MKKGAAFWVIWFGVCFLLGAPGFAQAQLKWKLVSTWTPSINILESDKNFAKRVNEISSGKLQISVHPAGELVPAPQVFDTVSKGSMEVGGECAVYWAGKNTAFELLSSYPMGLCQYDYINWYLHYGGKDLYNEIYGKFNMVYFITSVTPMESGVRSRVPIRTLADYKGKKLRFGGRMGGYVLNKIGASSVMVAGAEIYTALQLGTIDGAEFSSPSIDWGMGFSEVTKYNTGPGWHQPATVCGAMINKDAWNKLPADLKNAIEQAALANTLYMSAWFETRNIEALDKFKKAGTEVIKLPNTDLKTLEGYCWEYILDEAKKNPDFMKVALSQFQYLKDFRIARDAQEPFGQGRNPFTIPTLPGLK